MKNKPHLTSHPGPAAVAPSAASSGSAAVAPSAASPASPTLRDLYLACLSADADQPERALSLARRALAVWNSQNA